MGRRPKADPVAKRESELKDLCIQEMYREIPNVFVLPHQDIRKSGYPDISVSVLNKSTWWEFKHATPNFQSPGIQEFTCVKLAHRSYCRYILFVEHHNELKTLIVHPVSLAGCKGKLEGILNIEKEFAGHDFNSVAHFIRRVHEHRG